MLCNVNPNQKIMKPILHAGLIISFFLSVSLQVSAQSFSLQFDQTGKPCAAKIKENGVVSKFLRTDKHNPEWKIKGEHFGISVSDDVSECTTGTRTDSINWLQPGQLPEGDMIQDISFSPDGSYFATVCRHSNNVYFYDSESYELLNVFPTGEAPVDIEITDSLIYVCCMNSKDLYIIDPDTYTLADTISFTGTPVEVKVSPDYSTVYVAFYEFTDGYVGAYDVTTHDPVFILDDVLVHANGYYGYLGRILYSYTRFDLTEDGAYLICRSDQGPVEIYSASTGAGLMTIRGRYLQGSKLSASHDTLLLYAFNNASEVVYRINALNLTMIDSLERTNFTAVGGYKNLAVSGDASKAMGFDDWTGDMVLYDFNTMTVTEFPLTLGFGVTMFQSHNPDYVYFQSDVAFTIFDFNTHEIFQSGLEQMEVLGAVSPDGSKLVNLTGFDWLSNETLIGENICIRNISNPSTISTDTCFVSGSLPEADMTTTVCLAASGSKIVAANHISSNLSVFDAETFTPGEIQPMVNESKVISVPNSPYVVLYGASSLPVLYDITTNAVVAEIPLQMIWWAAASPDGQYVYLLTPYTLAKVSINGINTQITDILDVTFYAVSWSTIFPEEYEHYTKMGISPDGNTIVFAGYDEITQQSVMSVINTGTMEIEKVIPCSGYTGYHFAFTTDGTRVMVCYAQNAADIFIIDGQNSTLENTVHSQNIISVAYNHVTKRFLAGERNRLNEVDMLTGEIVDISYYSGQRLHQLAVDPNGEIIVRTQKKLFHGDLSFDLPGASGEFTYDQEYQRLLIPIPGPDYVCVYDPVTTSMKFLEPGNYNTLVIKPNPADDQITYEATEKITLLELFDLSGKRLLSKQTTSASGTLNTSTLPDGSYILRAKGEKGVHLNKMVVKH